MAFGKGHVPQDITFRGLVDELYSFDGVLSQEAINLGNQQVTRKIHETKNIGKL